MQNARIVGQAIWLQIMRLLLSVILVCCFSALLPYGVLTFYFDHWTSGLQLRDVYSISQDLNIDFRRRDSSGEPDSPLLNFEYDDVILGEPVVIILSFTALTQRLFRVVVEWNQNKTNSVEISSDNIHNMFLELQKILSDKYSKGASIIQTSYERTFYCNEARDGLANQVVIKNTRFTIELEESVPCNQLTIIYNDTKYSQLNTAEIKKKHNKLNRDYQKF